MMPEHIIGSGFEWDDRKSEKKALVREAATLVDNGAKVSEASIVIYERYHRASLKADALTFERNMSSIGKAIRLVRSSAE